MNIDDFKQTYVVSHHREEIFSEFLVYASTVNEYLSPFILLVYGSFISEKDYPKDIDILLHGFVKEEKFVGFNIDMVRSRERVHVKSEISALMQETKLKSESELIEWFENTENNKTKGIKVDEYVQIDF